MTSSGSFISSATPISRCTLLPAYRHEIPDEDAGGNAGSVMPATGSSMALHPNWDAIFGGHSSPYGVIFDADDKDGLSSAGVNEVEAQIDDPAIWAQEIADLAKQYGLRFADKHWKESRTSDARL
ncbi:hypothetical protein [Bradyrhizobium sp. BRP56]|uniref:hypothetical protein n=1 Tax=Bradyrhizobium sp. BRP56 TaxID=2793819 RepID=UPI001CD77772|nr:hypothetical protein [Bradyrhizobium sp. BRP56]MCA1397944.1 hypothetical protein [Bradyrhizobium sp. BRP56]